MLSGGILNPNILSLLARFRHTNTLVLADRGFPSWPGMEIVDISLVDGVPSVLQAFSAIRRQCVIGRIFMAREFARQNTPGTRLSLAAECGKIRIVQEAHMKFKLRVPGAVGIIRTGDTVQYANMILESA